MAIGQFMPMATTQEKLNLKWGAAQAFPGSISHTSSDMTYGNGKFVSVGSGGAPIIYSEDGVNWNSATFPGTETSFSRVRFGNGFFAVFTGRYVYKSTDAVNWTRSNMGRSYASISFGGGLFVGGDSYGEILTSTNVLNWTQRVPPFGYTNYSVKETIYSNGRFITLVKTPENSLAYSIFYSDDGWATYQELVLPPRNFSWAGSFLVGKYINYPTSGLSVATANISDDGLNWYSSDSLPFGTGSYGSRIAGDDRIAVLVTHNASAISYDGVYWEAVAIPTGLWRTIAFDGNRTFVAANSGNQFVVGTL